MVMSIKYADVIVDLQAGDTGKGKVAHALAGSGEYDVVLRYNGGANAGHTVYHPCPDSSPYGPKVVTHQVPIGVLFGIPSIIGLGCVVHIPSLISEISDLNARGFYTEGLIMIDKRAHVVTEEHLEEDGSDTKIGTTRKGIGPAYRDKYSRNGLRMGDIKNPENYTQFRIIDLHQYLHGSKGNPLKILCEGAQGFQIDIDWGDYPFVTSSHCTVGSACLNGIPPQKIRKIVGIMKAYETYVGNKTHFTDSENPLFKEIQEVGKEYGATTGRARKIRWLDLDGVIQAININGVTDLIINKIDVLQQVGKFAGEFHFIHKGKHHQHVVCQSFKDEVESIIREQRKGIKITWSTTPNGI